MYDYKVEKREVAFVRLPVITEKIDQSLNDLGLDSEIETEESVIYLCPDSIDYFFPETNDDKPQTAVRVRGRDKYVYIQLPIDEFVKAIGVIDEI